MKRHDVKPFLVVHTKEIIDKISFLTGCSLKSIGVDLCEYAVKSGVELELSQYFKRDINLGGKVYEKEARPKKFERKNGEVERITLTFDEPLYEYLHTLAYAIGCSTAKVVAYCIEKSMEDSIFITNYITECLTNKMDDNRKQLLEEIISDINRNYLSGEYSVAALLMCIADEFKQPTESFETAVENVVSTWN